MEPVRVSHKRLRELCDLVSKLMSVEKRRIMLTGLHCILELNNQVSGLAVVGPDFSRSEWKFTEITREGGLSEACVHGLELELAAWNRVSFDGDR